MNNEPRGISSFFSQELKSRFPAIGVLAGQVGDTRLIPLPGPAGAARIFGKCEWENPGGTVKDRVALAMLGDALESSPPGVLPSLLEYTGGSLGFALARFCNQLGVDLQLVIPSFIPASAREALVSLGSRIEVVDENLGFWAVMSRAIELSREHPERRFLYQHENAANLRVHMATTGPEIRRQLKEAGVLSLGAYIASIGTGGSLVGTATHLREVFPELRVIATSPSELTYGSSAPPNGLPKFSGSGGLGCGRKQKFVSESTSFPIEHLDFSYRECLLAIREFHAEVGTRIGSSAAANYLAARKVAAELGPDSAVVCLLPSLATPTEWERSAAWTIPERSNYGDKLKSSFTKRYETHQDSWSKESELRQAALMLLNESERRQGVHSNLRVLDIGTGRGKDAEFFFEQGHRVTGLDILPMPEWAQLQEESQGAMKFQATGFMEFESQERYDLILDAGCFHHQHPAEQGDYLDRIADLLETQGLGCLSVFTPNSPEAPQGYLTTIDGGRISRYFTLGEIQSLLTQHGLEVIRSERIPRPALNRHYLNVLFQRKEAQS